MADVVLPNEQVLGTGLSGATYTALNAVDTYYVDGFAGDLILHFKNTGAIATVTIDITQTFQGEAITDPTISIPATTGDVFVLPKALWEVIGGTHGGRIKFSQDIASGVTCAVLRT
jgi:hypothetical protein